MKRLAMLSILSSLAALGCGARPALAPHAAAPDGSAPPVVAAPDATPPPEQRIPYRAVAIAVGRLHACAILDDHSLKCWGDNSSGQLGLGDTRARGRDASEMGDALPAIDLGAGRTAKAVVARSYATCALLDDDSLKCWGQAGATPRSSGAIGDDPGELGDNLPPIDLGGPRARSIALGDQEVCVAREDDAVVCWEYAVVNAQPPTVITRRPTAAVVAMAGADSVLALFADGSISSLPARLEAQPLHFALPDGERAQAVFALDVKSCALLTTGGLRCWPTRGTTDPVRESPPTTDTDLTTLAFTRAQSTCWLTTSGAVKCHDYLGPWASPTDARQVGVVKLDRPAVAIDGGGQNMTCALLDDGRVKCWGADAQAPRQGGAAYSDAAWPAIDLGTHLVRL